MPQTAQSPPRTTIQHEQKTVLLLGASGMLGPALAHVLGPGRTLATHCSRPSASTVFFDARHTSVQQLLEGRNGLPQAAVIMLGITSIDACAREPVQTAQTNVHGIIRVIDELQALGIHVTFISSDGVFDGTRALSGEAHPPAPVLEYGRQKVAVENHLASRPTPSLTVRLPKLLCTRAAPNSMLHDWIRALGQPGQIKCATDQYFTPLAVDDAARSITRLLDASATGLFHVAGPQRLSRRELLAQLVAEYSLFATPLAEILDCRLGEIPTLEPRPLDTSMDTALYTRQFGPCGLPAQDVAKRAVRASFQPLSA
jgi:dTDP-4-dehydrorhamnose reductase